MASYNINDNDPDSRHEEHFPNPPSSQSETSTGLNDHDAWARAVYEQQYANVLASSMMSPYYGYLNQCESTPGLAFDSGFPQLQGYYGYNPSVHYTAPTHQVYGSGMLPSGHDGFIPDPLSAYPLNNFENMHGHYQTPGRALYTHGPFDASLNGNPFHGGFLNEHWSTSGATTTFTGDQGLHLATPDTPPFQESRVQQRLGLQKDPAVSSCEQGADGW